ncbi:glycosyltransferase family protein [Magnetospirillum gryphiswaldense]|uniref:Glycosyltransferase n=1 Tax=Magnetospirillum gryphiswaldense TaxID=55518 RepID=A4U1A7_9PROT|nr:hypothetical protein [Magnetospirillum gryphiswaldense]AVM75555.1 hypothetical protein MSR1_30890 [Magnetospirillum gryphiswaldense MSR-1]AVM79458.1 hypothetical protein MSR1L_30890 [Magnetospirillum gryphiswaldense]CAM76664.1 conserved hypothetical protein [Magnetospirillum gryphiswaldense MSR-1]
MRLVFVNHCHPRTPHVCATRVARMAEACARAGHQVVLLTETLDDQPPRLAPGEVPAALDAHDWALPFHLDCPPRGGRLAAALREGRGPRLLRRPLLAAVYLTRSGLFTDWRNGAGDYLPVLAKYFRPQSCWATFGNTDAWLIARSLARQVGGKWVADIKDPWSIFIPAPLRRILAARFTDAAAFTALSDQHGAEVQHWFGRDAVTVYSGIDDAFLAVPLPPPTGAIRLLLLGGLYDPKHLSQLADGLRLWGGKATLVYAGSEIAKLRAALPDWPLETPGYVDLAQLRHLAVSCHASLYVRNPRALYQHKLVELLALDRPTLCLPEEAPEAVAIAHRLGANFRSCANADSLARGLTEMLGRVTPVDRGLLAQYTWDAQAARLLEVLA